MINSKFVIVAPEGIKFPRIFFLICLFEYSSVQGSRYLLFGL